MEYLSRKRVKKMVPNKKRSGLRRLASAFIHDSLQQDDNHVVSNSNESNPAESYLLENNARLKRGNLSGQQFEDVQTADEGNTILETRVIVHPNALIMHINLREIGVHEGRGSIEIKPTENGLWLHAQEFDCYKNSPAEEAQAMKRNISRNYTVSGNFNWNSLVKNLMPDGTLHITVPSKCHPAQLAFPPICQGPIYSSLPIHKPDFPPTGTCTTFSTFAEGTVFPETPKSCFGESNSVGVQTPGPSVETQTSQIFSSNCSYLSGSSFDSSMSGNCSSLSVVNCPIHW